MLDRFIGGAGIYDTFPAIRIARDEPCKCRLTLIRHCIAILDTYESMHTEADFTETAKSIKAENIPLDLEGYWDDADPSVFWHFEATRDEGVFFATRYAREEGRVLTATRYSATFTEAERIGGMAVFMLHPASMERRLKGLTYTDADNAWYSSPLAATTRPDSICLKLLMRSSAWPETLQWQRITAPDEIERRDAMAKTYAVIDPYEESRYDFSASIYAITQDAVYVLDDQEQCLYRLPRDNEPALT